MAQITGAIGPSGQIEVDRNRQVVNIDGGVIEGITQLMKAIPRASQ
jgi:hypothetical protein